MLLTLVLLYIRLSFLSTGTHFLLIALAMMPLAEMGYLVLVLVLKYIFWVLVLVLVLGCDVLVPIKNFLNC